MACPPPLRHPSKPAGKKSSSSRWPQRLLFSLFLIAGLSLGLASWQAYADWNSSTNSAGINLLAASSSSKLITIRAQAADPPSLLVSREPKLLSLPESAIVVPDLRVPAPRKDEKVEKVKPVEELPPPIPEPVVLPRELEPVKHEVKPPEPPAPKIEAPPPLPMPLLIGEPQPPKIDVPPPPPPPTLPVQEKAVADTIVVHVPPQVRPLGDTPMKRNWNTLSWVAVVAMATVVAPPAIAQTTDTNDVKTILERLGKMDKSLAEMGQKISTDMQALKSANDEMKKDLTPLMEEVLKQRLKLDLANSKMELLETQLNKLGKDLDELKKRLPAEGIALYPPAEKGAIDDIKTKLGQIEQMLNKMQVAAPRVSLSPPPSTGRVILVNLYNEELLFLINQKPYRVAPNSTMTLENQPVGSLAYEVISGTWGMRARNTVTLSANETFTLTAR